MKHVSSSNGAAIAALLVIVGLVASAPLFAVHTGAGAPLQHAWSVALGLLSESAPTIATFAFGGIVGAVVLSSFSESPFVTRKSAVAQPAAAPGPDLDAARLLLSHQIATALQAFRDQSESTGQYATALASGQTPLSVEVDAAQLKSIVMFFNDVNARMIRANEAYRIKLKESSDKIEKLRAELVISKERNEKDSLTKVASRRLFDETLTREVAKSNATSAALSLIMLDIDRFKLVNDTFGHQIGDDLLRQIAHILTLNTKGGDCVARYGGEEFAIVLPAADSRGAAALAERIRRKLEQTKWKKQDGSPIGVVTASLGVAQHRPDESPETLIERADANLYKAKNGGRNRVVS